MQQTVIIRPSN